MSVDSLTAQFLRHVGQTSAAPLGIVVERARGSSLWDASGREYLDLLAGMGVANVGHGNPAVIEAVAAQAARYLHVMVYGEAVERPQVELARRLASLAPGDLSVSFFTNSGTEAIEGAIKLARKFTRRSRLIAWRGGYHGDTLGAMSVGRGSGFFNLFRNMMCQVAVLPFPYTFEGDEAAEDREKGALIALEDRLWNGTHDTAALIIEPLLQGAGGMRMCRPEFLARLVEMAQSAGVLVIFDEVATGFGRTGTLFAMQQAGVVPDLVCLSKGLTSGYMPMAVTVARDRVFEAFLGEDFDRALPHGHSFTANPLACAVALRSLILFAEEDTLGRILRIAARHRVMLGELRAREDVVRPRLLGSILAFDLKGEASYQSAQSQALKARFLSRGLNIRPLGSTVYLMPPYCTTDEELARAYAGLSEGLDWLAANRP